MIPHVGSFLRTTRLKDDIMHPTIHTYKVDATKSEPLELHELSGVGMGWSSITDPSASVFTLQCRSLCLCVSQPNLSCKTAMPVRAQCAGKAVCNPHFQPLVSFHKAIRATNCDLYWGGSTGWQIACALSTKECVIEKATNCSAQISLGTFQIPASLALGTARLSRRRPKAHFLRFPEMHPQLGSH